MLHLLIEFQEETEIPSTQNNIKYKHRESTLCDPSFQAIDNKENVEIT